MKKNIYYWASDISKNSGEGILANSFISNYSKENKKIKFINISKNDIHQKKNNFIKNYYNYNSLYHKYIHPIVGVIKLWKIYKKNKEISYINYLPLWNFILFFLLPKKTILGPITGSINRNILVSFIFNNLEKLSLFIIKKKKFEIFFSHNFFLEKHNLNKKKFKYNFILKDFKFKKNNKEKKYDFVIYYRKNSKLKKNYIYNLIYLLIDQKFKIVVIGDKINFKKIKNMGYIPRSKTQKIISETHYAIANPENLFSYFVQDCISVKVRVFYNHFFKKYNIFNLKTMTPIYFKSYSEDFSIIMKSIRK